VRTRVFHSFIVAVAEAGKKEFYKITKFADSRDSRSRAKREREFFRR